MQELNLSLLAGNNYRVYNYKIAKKYGINEAIMLADLISKYLYFSKNNRLIENEWFCSSAEDIYKTTALSQYQQTKAVKKLEELGFIETKLKGIPAIKHYSIGKNIHRLFFENLDYNYKLY